MTSLPDYVHPIFARHEECLRTQDIDALMETYHTDAVVVRFQGILNGIDEIRATFSKYLGLSAETVELLEYAQSEDTIMVRAIMKVRGETEIGFGTYVLRDGKIWRHSAGIEGGMRDWFADGQ